MNGALVSAEDALAHAGIEPIRLAPKEGLALLNGTQVSTALALAGWLLWTSAGSAVAARLSGRRAPRVEVRRGAPEDWARGAAAMALSMATDAALSREEAA